MRQYLRHPTDIPLQFRRTGTDGGTREVLRNVGHGGLCFRAGHAIASGTMLHLTIPLHSESFEADGTVVWCRPTTDGFEIGVRFADDETEFAVRMVEQACHIEHYKCEVLAREGRRLSGEEAAAEWIARYAKDFPA